MADIDTSFYPKQQDNNLLGIVQQAGVIKNLGLEAQQRQLDLVKGQVGYLVDGFSSLASKADLSPEDFYTFGKRAVQEHIITPEVYAAEAQAVAAAGNDPAKLRALATNYGLRALDAGQRFNEQYGTPSTIDNGQYINPVTVSPLTGIHPLGAPIQKTLTPAESATPTQIGVTAQGQPIGGTLSQYLIGAGADPNTGLPMNPNALTGGSAGGNALMPGVVNQPAATTPTAPTAPTAPAAPQAPKPAQGIVTTLPAGQAAAMEETGRGSGQMLNADRAAQANYQQAVTPLEKAIPALEAMGTRGTGPGTEQVNEIKSFLQSMGFLTDTQDIKNFDEAKKYLTQYVNQTGNTGTNDKLAASFAGNPSVGISNAAAIDVAKTALSLARLQNAKVRAFDASGQPQSAYSQWATNFASAQDPRAYGFDLMKPEERAALVKSMSPAEKTRFVNSLKTAMQLGLVTPPGSANGQ